MRGYYRKRLNKVREYALIKAYIESTNIRSVEPIDNTDLQFIKGMRIQNLLSVSGAFALLKLLSIEDNHLLDMPFYRITKFPDFELCP